MDKKRVSSFIGIVLIIVFFIISSYFVQIYIDEISGVLDVGILGMIIYVLVTILAIVIAPISAVPLIPVASILWGVTISALLNIMGWTIGGYIAFILARKYGVPLIKKFIPIDKINSLDF